MARAFIKGGWLSKTNIVHHHTSNPYGIIIRLAHQLIITVRLSNGT